MAATTHGLLRQLRALLQPPVGTNHRLLLAITGGLCGVLEWLMPALPPRARAWEFLACLQHPTFCTPSHMHRATSGFRQVLCYFVLATTNQSQSPVHATQCLRQLWCLQPSRNVANLTLNSSGRPARLADIDESDGGSARAITHAHTASRASSASLAASSSCTAAWRA